MIWLARLNSNASVTYVEIPFIRVNYFSLACKPYSEAPVALVSAAPYLCPWLNRWMLQLHCSCSESSGGPSALQLVGGSTEAVVENTGACARL